MDTIVGVVAAIIGILLIYGLLVAIPVYIAKKIWKR